MSRLALASQVVVEAAIGREVGENMVPLAKVQKVSRGERIQIGFVIRYLALKNAD
jgi:hypothetical protein